MAKKPMQKQKLLYLMKIMLDKTDEMHGLTTEEIKTELARYGIAAERKSLYDDLRVLELYGLDICSEKTKTVRYYVGSRDFQISELKLLVDAIQSSKFITQKKSLELIGKLESLASENEAKLLQNQVIISNRVKTDNETIYYNVDRLHDAISGNLSVSFYYKKWVLDFGSPKKIKLERRHGGKLYRVSPWALCWDDENYYLIGYDEDSEQIRHYRVDKMEKINLTEDSRKGETEFNAIDLAEYSKSTFSMFAGERTDITLRVHERLIGVMADRFGRDVFITRDSESTDHFLLKVEVNVSDQFFGWLFALGDDVRLISPDSVVRRFSDHCNKVIEIYKEASV
ncbi:MAG: WYL domain-containing protein [Ruminococcus sp.]|nr:WYL domain-containing protein [Ruminococcus sp.]